MEKSKGVKEHREEFAVLDKGAAKGYLIKSLTDRKKKPYRYLGKEGSRQRQ